MIKAKRRYRSAQAAASGEHFAIILDGKAARTPAGAALIVPTAALADAIAEEWQAQGADIAPESMPLTRLANAAIDRVGPNRAAVIAAIAAYADSDLVCYRATEPDELVKAQDEAFVPLLEWAKARFGVAFRTGAGIMPIDQQKHEIAKLEQIVAGLDDMRLSALHLATACCGSLVLALALAEGRIDAAEALALSETEEAYQAGRWGLDPVYIARRDALGRELASAARFMELCRA